MRVVACYPRSMSAWLSNLITVPCCSLYAHDILMFPDMVEVIESLEYPNKGIVDTAASADNLPECELTVIDNNPETVERRCKRLFPGIDVLPLVERMEALKPRATVYHMDDMEDWIEEFYEEHTGLPMDWNRYRILKNLDVQSRLGRSLEH